MLEQLVDNAILFGSTVASVAAMGKGVILTYLGFLSQSFVRSFHFLFRMSSFSPWVRYSIKERYGRGESFERSIIVFFQNFA